MQINIQSPGNHNFEPPGEAEDYIKELLKRAGFTEDWIWECRIEKMLHCSSETPPIRVVGYKSHGIVLKVKSQKYATRHQQMTLISHSELLCGEQSFYNSLKAVEQVIPTFDKSIPTFDNPVPTPVLNMNKTIAFDNLQRIQDDYDKLVFVLTKIDELSKQNIKTKEEFINHLRKDLSWEKFLFRICSRALNDLVKQEYMMEVVGTDNKTIKGFTLTDKGLAIVLGLPVTTVKTEKKEKEKEKETGSDFFITKQTVLSELAGLSAKMADNERKIKLLMDEAGQLKRNTEELITRSRELYRRLIKE